VQIDEVKPGRIVHRSGKKLDSRTKTFSGLTQAKEKSVSLENVTLTVGQGSRAVQIMVGEISVNAEYLESILKAVLEKFEATTPVTMTFRSAQFSSGHDLKQFAETLGLDLQPGDVEQ
jgi:hypothetical protein